MISRFSKRAKCRVPLLGTLHLVLSLVGMRSATTVAASMRALMKFSYSSFGVYISDIS